MWIRILHSYPYKKILDDVKLIPNIIENLEEIHENYEKIESAIQDMLNKFDGLKQQSDKNVLNAKFGLALLTCGFFLQILANVLKM